MQSPLPAEAASLRRRWPPPPLLRMALHACTWAVPVLLRLPSPQMDSIWSEIKHPLSLGTTAQVKRFLLGSSSSITGWSRTGCRLQRTWLRRWRCRTPRGHQTCTNAVYGHSCSRLCNGHHPNPHSGSVGHKGKVITSERKQRWHTLLLILHCQFLLTNHFYLLKLHKGCISSGSVWVQWHTGPGPDCLMGNPQKFAASVSICPRRKTCTKKEKYYF